MAAGKKGASHNARTMRTTLIVAKLCVAPVQALTTPQRHITAGITRDGRLLATRIFDGICIGKYPT